MIKEKASLFHYLDHLVEDRLKKRIGFGMALWGRGIGHIGSRHVLCHILSPDLRVRSLPPNDQQAYWDRV